MPTGLELIRAEMARQHGDALASLQNAGATARQIAQSMQKTKRLLMLGMGGSQYVNRIAEPLYRAEGIDATALVVSELLRAPLPPARRTVLLTSQSGESGEILRYLEKPIEGEERFGMTLNAESRLGRAVPCLVAAGGSEKAFAATRSMMLTLTLHAAVLAELGVDIEPLRTILRKPPPANAGAAIEALAACRAVVYSGRGALQGVAEAAALGLMELARMPAFAEEGGQLQHGPLEMLGEGVGVVLFRPAGADAGAAARLVEIAHAAGSPVVVFDVSGEPALAHAVTVALPKADGLAAAASIFPAMQETMIGVATRLVARVGEPVRSTKVSDGE